MAKTLSIKITRGTLYRSVHYVAGRKLTLEEGLARTLIGRGCAEETTIEKIKQKAAPKNKADAPTNNKQV